MLLSDDDVKIIKDQILILLESICEDDHVILSDYVIALLKHESDFKSLKDFCSKQLYEFLQDETDSFVGDLFKFLVDKNISNVAKSAEDLQDPEPSAPEKEPTFNEAQQNTNEDPNYEYSDEEDRDRNFKHIRGPQTTTFSREDPTEHNMYNASENIDNNSQQKFQSRYKNSQGQGNKFRNQQGHLQDRGRQPKRPSEYDPSKGDFHLNGGNDMHQLQFVDSSRKWVGRGAKRFAQMPDKKYKRRFQEYGDKNYDQNDNEEFINHEKKHNYSSGRNAHYKHRMNSDDNGVEQQAYQRDQETQNDKHNKTDDQPSSIEGSAHKEFSSDERGGYRQTATQENPDDHGHNKPRRIPGNNQDNNRNTIVVSNIPQDSFSVDTIGQYFKRFGTIVNLSLKTGPPRAIVQFSNNQEAQSAFKSPDPVFNNRFVRVNWNRYDPSYKSQQQRQRMSNIPPPDHNYFGFRSPKVQYPAPEYRNPGNHPPKPDNSAAEKLLEIHKNLIRKQLMEQESMLSMLRSNDISEKDKAIILEQLKRLSSLTKKMIDDANVIQSKPPTQNKPAQTSVSQSDLQSINVIRDSRNLVESEIKKLKSHIGINESDDSGNSSKKTGERTEENGNSSSNLKDAVIKVECANPVPPETVESEFGIIGPLKRISTTENGLSHLLKFNNPGDTIEACRRKKSESTPFWNNLSVTLVRENGIEFTNLGQGATQ